MQKIRKKNNILISISLLLFCVSCEEINYEARSRYREKSEIKYTVYNNRYSGRKRQNNNKSIYNNTNNIENDSEDVVEETDAVNNNEYKSNYTRYDNREVKNNSKNNSNNNTLYKKPKNYTGYYKVGQPYSINGKTYYPAEVKSYKGVGLASWYGEDFHNKKTANGENYDMNDMTAAHRTLPLPSIVKVTNLGNKKSIIVRVNDRGPFVDNRIIDLSSRAAEELDIKRSGLAKVKVEFLKKETDKMLKEFGLK